MVTVQMGTLSEVKYTNILNEIVAERVERGAYPTPTPLKDAEIAAKMKEIQDYTTGVTPRPASKEEYVSHLTELTMTVTQLQVENNQIAVANKAARDAVDQQYETDINDARSNATNQGDALCVCIDYQLQVTQWWMLPDSQLSQAQKTIASAWRMDMMNVVVDYTTIVDALARYDYLMDNKPDFMVKWGQ